MSLPPLYAAWMRALLGDDLPAEPRATCDDCAMAPRPGDAPGERRFDPALKCCTFYPALPNFTVGAILEDREASGRGELRRRFERGAGVSPLGVARPVAYETLFARSPKGDAFGNSVALRCGFLDGDGRCGIWRHREATCVSYFCRFERGVRGRDLWAALRELLMIVERQLALWCVVELDPGDAALGALMRAGGAHAPSARGLDGRGDPAEHRLLWGRWAGREFEFFVEAARRVRALAWADVVAIGGVEVAGRARILRAAFAAHGDRALPEALRLGAHQVVAIDANAARLVGAIATDPITLAAGVAAALPAFDGRPHGEVLGELTARGTAPTPSELARLVDLEILIPASRLVRRPPAPPPGAPGTATEAS